MKAEDRKLVNKDEETQAGKKPYDTPKLTIHGDVEKITKSLGGSDTDGLGGSQPLDAPVSDRNVKENFVPVDERDILARVATLPIETWNYMGQPAAVRHIGPMAQDFAKAFGVGEDDKRIHMIDASGVALAAIQGLYQMAQEKDAQIRGLQQQLQELQAANGTLVAEVESLKRQVAYIQAPAITVTN